MRSSRTTTPLNLPNKSSAHRPGHGGPPRPTRANSDECLFTGLTGAVFRAHARLLILIEECFAGNMREDESGALAEIRKAEIDEHGTPTKMASTK